MRELIHMLGSAASLALGLFQLVTLTIGLHNYLGWHYVFTVFIALCLAPWALVGTAASIFAAPYAWGWPLIQSAILLIAALVVTILLNSADGAPRSAVPRRRN